MTAVVGWLTLVAAGLAALVVIAGTTVKVYRFGVKLGRAGAELAKLPAAVHELADQLRAATVASSARLDQHEYRLSALEAARQPEGASS